MGNKLLVIFLLFLSFSVNSQNKTIAFPKGIYKTFEDFKKRVPSDSKTEFRKKIGIDSIWYKFYKMPDEKRLKKEFAYSDGQNLFVSLKLMRKYFPKDDKSQLKDDGNFCLLAKRIGNKYVYFESYFTSKNAVLWGGLAAGGAARRLKGVVYDVENETFNLFKNADDFENFIKENHPKYLQEVTQARLRNPKKNKKRKKNKENLELIRRIINEVYEK